MDSNKERRGKKEIQRRKRAEDKLEKQRTDSIVCQMLYTYTKLDHVYIST